MRKRNKIKSTWPSLSMEEEINVLFSEQQEKLSEYPGDEIEIGYSALMESTDIDNGEKRELLVLHTAEGGDYATVSPTFIDSFVTIADWLCEKGKLIDRVKIRRDNSKKGREFLVCEFLSYKEGVDNEKR